MIISGYMFTVTAKARCSSPFHDLVNHVAKLESLLLIVVGLVLYAYPDVILVKLGLATQDAAHTMLIRMCGAILFSMSFESQNVSEFIYLKDKKTFMLSRILVSF